MRFIQKFKVQTKPRILLKSRWLRLSLAFFLKCEGRIPHESSNETRVEAFIPAFHYYS